MNALMEALDKLGANKIRERVALLFHILRKEAFNAKHLFEIQEWMVPRHVGGTETVFVTVTIFATHTIAEAADRLQRLGFRFCSEQDLTLLWGQNASVLYAGPLYAAHSMGGNVLWRTLVQQGKISKPAIADDLKIDPTSNQRIIPEGARLLATR